MGTIVLNRGSKKNAYSLEMYVELTKALNSASSSEEVKVVFLTGAGDYFSSGNDLSNFRCDNIPYYMNNSFLF